MEEGDLAYVEYDVWILPEEEDGEEMLFDTTDEEKAEENDIFDEDADYGPKAIVVGSGDVVDGFDEALVEAEVDEEDSVEVPPEKGIGQREAEKIELFSRRKLERKGIDPVAGKEVEIDNRRGRIIQATAGRVRIDFNHPLAGKTLRYDFEVVEKPETPEETVQAVLEMDYKKSDFEIDMDDDKLDIIIPEECKVDQRWFVSKYRVVGDLREHIDAEVIRFIERYEEKEEEETEEEEESEEETEEGSEEEGEEEDEE